MFGIWRVCLYCRLVIEHAERMRRTVLYPAIAASTERFRVIRFVPARYALLPLPYGSRVCDVSLFATNEGACANPVWRT